MTEEEKELARRKVMAEMEEEERRRQREQHGVLWGAWSSERLKCRHCGVDHVWPENEESFLDPDHAFSETTRELRATLVFDLRHRQNMDIPDWVTPDTELWQDQDFHWQDALPDTVLMRATIQDMDFGTYGKETRLCDSTSHVFVRACTNCNGHDPLGIVSEFQDRRFQELTPPHDFLDTLIADQTARRERAAQRTEHRRKLSALSPFQRRMIQAGLIRVGSECLSCGTDQLPESRTCSKCGDDFF